MSEDATEPDDAEFLDLILETDVANIIKKAQGGLPLTKREREMLVEERTRRQKSPPQTAFALEGEGANPLEKLTQRELAELWGYSLRQVKNWIHDGRAANDPAPVTRPDEMPGWFRRIYAPRECPEKLRLAALRIVAGNPVTDNKPSAATGPPVARLEIPDAEKGLLAMLDRYRTAEVSLHNKYMAAVDAGDETRASFLMSEWKKMGESVRALEKTAPKALEELRIYVRRDEIQRELEPLHAAILKAIRQGFRGARGRLKAADGADEWGQLVDVVVDDIARMLVETEFREPLELEAA